jgi:hypothetical protein
MFNFLKGKINIKLDNYNYSQGQVITGKVILSLKKPMTAKELTISLIGTEKTTRNTMNSHSSRYREVFNFKMPLDGNKEYPNHPIEYPFKINIPKTGGQQNVPEGAMGTVLKTVQMFSTGRSVIKWNLKARLDVSGFDLTKKVQINIA